MKNSDGNSIIWKIGALVISSLAMVFLAWYFAEQDEEKQANELFNFQILQAQTAIQDRMLAYEQVLRGGVGLFDASVSVEREEWRAYVAGLRINENYPGIQGIGFSQRIRPSELAAHIAQIRKQGYPGYTVWPAGAREEYTPVVFLEPFEGNQRAFGYDQSSDNATRRAAQELARDGGKAAISGKVKLVTETDRDAQAGFLMLLPVYRHNGVPHGNVEERRAALMGYVYSPFRMNDLMLGIGKFTPDIALQIYDGAEATENALMFSSDPDTEKNPHFFSATREVNINGHVWTLRFRTLPSFEASVGRELPMLIALFGIVLTVFLALLLWSLLRTRSRALALANAMTVTLRESEERFRSVVETAADGIIVINEKAIIESCNPATTKIFGYSVGEMIGNNVNMLMPEPYHSQHDGYVARYFSSRETRLNGHKEVTGLRKDGASFPMELSLGAMQAGEKHKIIGMVRDITARTEAEANIRQHNQELSELNQKLQETQNQLLQSEKMASVGQLAAGVAHEINNPIGYVYSNLGTLEKYMRDIFGMLDAYRQAESVITDGGELSRLQAAKQKFGLEYLKEDVPSLMNESKEGITRVKKIVQDLKDFSHVDASEEWHWVNLSKGIDSTLNIVNNEIKYKAEVVKEYGALPEVECLFSQLNQVFLNLLVNAAHAIEGRGTITIRTGSEGEEVWVEIADTGKGIAPEHIKKIFDPFFTTKPVGQGTGLGLSLSYGIVQKHHGRIEVQSEVGKGTTFRVWLPVRQPPADAV